MSAHQFGELNFSQVIGIIKMHYCIKEMLLHSSADIFYSLNAGKMVKTAKQSDEECVNRRTENHKKRKSVEKVNYNIYPKNSILIYHYQSLENTICNGIQIWHKSYQPFDERVHNLERFTEDPRYNDTVCYQRFCCYKET